MYSNFSFSYQSSEKTGKARRGILKTPHGDIQTPAFIFCATKASIKAVPIPFMEQANTQIILSNTYHLMLRPGADLIQRRGGLHKFMGWNGPMFTDSGGFQIFSLGYGSVAAEIKGKRFSRGDVKQKTLVKITEEGATFKSYIDGRQHVLTPEKSIQVQQALGADLIVVLDECTPYHVDKDYTARSMSLSHRWALRSLEEFKKGDNGTQALYGIVQGGVYPNLRRMSADFLNDNNFFAHAIGGSLGAEKSEMYDVVGITTDKLLPSRPIHLLGIGGVKDIFRGVELGIDTFDCVHPTRLGRHGGALVKPQYLKDGDAGVREHINLNNHVYKEDDSPIESDCGCYTCKNYSRAYLHYLLKAQELLVYTLISAHNIFFINRLFEEIRKGIEQNNLEQVKKEWVVA